ncbi:MAG: arginine--tRNA ligase [Spirochaetia bacterium]
MKLLTTMAEDLIFQALQNSGVEIDRSKVYVQFTKDLKFGHLQSPVAMALAKELKKNPREIASLIEENLPENSIIADARIAGPGFINLFITQDMFITYIQNIFTIEKDEDVNPDEQIVIDYSSPNIAKRMHIGHLRSTIIGDALRRIFSYLGHTVIGDNHLGDWGTQFGKLIIAYRNWLDEAAYAENPVKELERLYVEFEKHSQENPELLDQARHELTKLQKGEEKNTALWHEFIDMSLKEYNKTYDRLGVAFDTYYGESHYNAVMPEIVTELEEKNIAQESQGAKVVFFEDDEHLHPCIIQKKDGAYLYATSDLGCIKFRMNEYNLDRIVYVTDNRQETHFRQVFRIKERMGWDVQTDHVSFGIMRFKEGSFSTRKGNVIYLSDLLDQAEAKALEVVNEKNPSLPDDEKKEIAKKVGIGAIKYFDLSQNRSSDIIFSWEKALSFEGNTAPYLQYTYARIQSLKGKAGDVSPDSIKELDATEEIEKRILFKLLQFPNAVRGAASSYKPNVLADYIYDLSQDFNSFYNAHKIIFNGEVNRTRLFLAHHTGRVVEQALAILGIEVSDRM